MNTSNKKLVVFGRMSKNLELERYKILLNYRRNRRLYNGAKTVVQAIEHAKHVPPTEQTKYNGRFVLQ